jgi:E3 ubiquitin-protein ligase HUWE1
LISGLPEIDVDDWKNNTEYHNYSASSPQIQWLWRAIRSFAKEERAKLLQFVTGTSKVPLNGFKELEGMNGVSRFNIHRDYGNKDRLPTTHTCFNRKSLAIPAPLMLDTNYCLQSLIFLNTIATKLSASVCILQ